MCQAEFILLDLIGFLKGRGVENTESLIYDSWVILKLHAGVQTNPEIQTEHQFQLGCLSNEFGLGDHNQKH
jgi:hypothetical protein